MPNDKKVWSGYHNIGPRDKLFKFTEEECTVGALKKALQNIPDDVCIAIPKHVGEMPDLTMMSQLFFFHSDHGPLIWIE